MTMDTTTKSKEYKTKMQKDTTTKSTKEGYNRIQQLNPQTISNQMKAKARISLHEIMGENDLGSILFDYF